MTKLVDPIKLLQKKARAAKKGEEVSATQTSLTYEIPFVPPLGARLLHLTVASGYRAPINVIFDPATRTTYPLSVD